MAANPVRMIAGQRKVLEHLPASHLAFRPETFTELRHIEGLAAHGMLRASRFQGAFRLSPKGREAWAKLQVEGELKRRGWWKKHQNPTWMGADPALVAQRAGRMQNPLSIRFMRYVGPAAKWYDDLANRWRKMRSGSTVIVDTGDLGKRTVPIATRGKGFVVDTRREFLREVAQVAPRQGASGWLGQLLVSGKEAHDVRTSLQHGGSSSGGGFGALGAYARRSNPADDWYADYGTPVLVRTQVAKGKYKWLNGIVYRTLNNGAMYEVHVPEIHTYHASSRVPRSDIRPLPPLQAPRF